MLRYKPGTTKAPTRQESDSLEPTQRRSDKPAILHLKNGESIQVDHHIHNISRLALVISREETEKGIDLKIPYGRIMAIETNQTRSGKEALGKLMGWD